MSNLHAHIQTTSQDCDGRYSNEYIVFFDEDETAESQQEFNDFSEIHFMDRVLLTVASPYATRGMTITIDEHGIDSSETTEEGFRHASAVWCRTDCTDTKVYFRDHSAERAGY